MPAIHVKTMSGEDHDLQAESGRTLMEAIRDNGIEDLLAICGGCCSCATCHVYVDIDNFKKLPDLSEEENDLLDSSDFRKNNSRLSCQIIVQEYLDGMNIEIAPRD